MHGQYPSRIKEADVDFKQTNNWLKGTGLKAETEGLIIAAQDQSLASRLYHRKIIKDGTSQLCRYVIGMMKASTIFYLDVRS